MQPEAGQLAVVLAVSSCPTYTAEIYIIEFWEGPLKTPKYLVFAHNQLFAFHPVITDDDRQLAP